MSMFQYIAQHPWIGVVLVLLIALTIFVWYKAIVSGKKRNEERERIIADLEKEKALRNEFRNPDEATFLPEKDDYRLIVGMCANIQMKLEKATNMNDAFAELSDVKKNVYCLGCFARMANRFFPHQRRRSMRQSAANLQRYSIRSLSCSTTTTRLRRLIMSFWQSMTQSLKVL